MRLAGGRLAAEGTEPRDIHGQGGRRVQDTPEALRGELGTADTYSGVQEAYDKAQEELKQKNTQRSFQQLHTDQAILQGAVVQSVCRVSRGNLDDEAESAYDTPPSKKTTRRRPGAQPTSKGSRESSTPSRFSAPPGGARSGAPSATFRAASMATMSAAASDVGSLMAFDAEPPQKKHKVKDDEVDYLAVLTGDALGCELRGVWPSARLVNRRCHATGRGRGVGPGIATMSSVGKVGGPGIKPHV